MKKSLVIVLALVLVFCLAACTAAPAAETTATEEPAEAEPADAGSGDTIIIGMANYAPDINGMLQQEAFQQFADDWNAAGKTPKLECYVTNANASADKQIGDVQSLVSRGCNVIYLEPVDPTGLIPAAQEAISQGVMILGARGMTGDGIVTFRAGDENIMAETSFVWYDKLLTDNPDLNLKVGVMYGLASMTDQLIRVDHLIELIQEKYPDRIEVLASQPCDWDAQKGMECMENWYQTYQGEMNCIISAAASMAVGGAQALVAAGEDIGNDWIITCYDNTEDVVNALMNDQASMTIGLDASMCGYRAAEICVGMVQGTETETEYVLGSEIMTTIDTDNVEAWAEEHPDSF